MLRAGEEANGSSSPAFEVSRDGVCLLTDAMASDCTAAYILPSSRPDVSVRLQTERHAHRVKDSFQVYQDVLKINRPPPMYSPMAGLLLLDVASRLRSS